MKRRASFGFAIWLCLYSASAFAAPRAELAEAERAYQAGKALLGAGAYDRALVPLSRSQELDPAVGTMLLMAECHEKLGHPSKALDLYNNALATARSTNKPKSEKKALGRIEALSARVARLRVVLVAADEGAEVSVDGTRIDPAQEATYDPGQHRLNVFAHGGQWATTLTLEPGKRTVNVPRVSPAPLVVVAPPASIPPPLESPPAQPTSSFRGPAGIAVAGLGAVGLGVGIAFGASAISQKGEAEAACPDRTACRTREGADAWSSAASAGTVSTAFVVAGLALVVGGGVLWLTAPRTEPARKLGLHLDVTGVRGVF